MRSLLDVNVLLHYLMQGMSIMNWRCLGWKERSAMDGRHVQ